MKFVKYLGALALTAVLLFVFVANFSSVASNFECSGNISSDGAAQPTTVYLVLEEYRWWVGLWSDSDGNVKLEIPNMWFDYFGHIKEVGNQRQIYKMKGEILAGNFSASSKTLALNTPFGFFDGKCKNIN